MSTDFQLTGTVRLALVCLRTLGVESGDLTKTLCRESKAASLLPFEAEFTLRTQTPRAHQRSGGSLWQRRAQQRR